MNSAATAYSVFLSYAQTDAAWVAEFSNALQQLGAHGLFDPTALVSSQSFIDTVESALRQSDTLIIFLSSNSLENPNVLFELGAAIGGNKKIIPVLIGDIDYSEFLRLIPFIQVIRAVSPTEAAKRVARYIDGGIAIQLEAGRWIGEAARLNNMAATHYENGDLFEALGLYQQALALMREIGYRRGEAAMLNNIATVYNEHGDRIEAMKLLQQALALMRETGEHRGEAAILNNMAKVYIEIEQFTKATQLLHRALVFTREIGDQGVEAEILINMAKVYIETEQFTKATELLQRALVLTRVTGDQGVEAETLINMIETGRLDQALALCEQALATAREAEDRARDTGTLSMVRNLNRL